VEERRACIVVINKWDLIEPGGPHRAREEIERRNKGIAKQGPNVMTTLSEFGEWVQEKIIFPGLRAGDFHLGEIRVSTGSVVGSGALCGGAFAAESADGDLNRTLQDAVERRQPVSSAEASF